MHKGNGNSPILVSPGQDACVSTSASKTNKIDLYVPALVLKLFLLHQSSISLNKMTRLYVSAYRQSKCNYKLFLNLRFGDTKSRIEGLRFTFTPNGRRQIQIENFSEYKISR